MALQILENCCRLQNTVVIFKYIVVQWDNLHDMGPTELYSSKLGKCSHSVAVLILYQWVHPEIWPPSITTKLLPAFNIIIFLLL